MRLSTRLIIAVTVIVVVVLVVGILATLPTFTRVFTQFEIWMSIWVIVFFSAALLLGIWFAIIEIQARRHHHLRFAPSEQGYYEALLLPDNTFVKPADNVPLDVPHTYSPKLIITQEGGTLPPLLEKPTQSHPIALSEILEHLSPNALEFIYGLDPETGELVKTPLPKAVHMQLMGGTNMGKSHQATSILTQLVTRNDTSRLNLALIDCEGETTTPFQQVPHVKYLATEPKEAARTFRQLVLELERRDITKQTYPIILVFVEEFLNLRRTMPPEYRDQALEDYTTLALRGRKRGIFLFSIGQTAYTEKAIRDAQLQFFSSMAFAIKPSAARSAGFTNTPLLNKLYSERRPGQFLLERPQGDALLLAPHVNYADIPTLLKVPQNRDLEPDRAAIEDQGNAKGMPMERPNALSIPPALQAKATEVVKLLSQGNTNKQEIIFAVWGVRPGRSEKYHQAEDEYTQILQFLGGLYATT